MSWFSVSKQGLAQILERKGKVFALYELLQNAFDSNPSAVQVELVPIHGEPYATLVVRDDGDGFEDLSDAHTMFAKSRRAGDVSKRGRFGLGEKMVLAICREARISSRTGTIYFCKDAESVHRSNTDKFNGTEFSAEIKMTRDELEECVGMIRRVIPPVPTFLNSQEIWQLTPITQFSTKLPTVFWDEDGVPHNTSRITTVQVFGPLADGNGEILEMGIPIVEADFDYRCNIMQKVPLNLDRDNVSPSYLKALGSAMLNNIHKHLEPEQVSKPWVQEAMGSSVARPEAIKDVLVKQYGDKAVVATPGDVIANATAERAGFTVIPGGALSRDAWANVRKHELLVPAGRAFPTPQPEQLANIADMASGNCPTCGRKY